MKKILITLLLGLLSLNLYAQHMKFNGVEITGSLSSFVAKLKAKGWRDYTNIDEGLKNDPTMYVLTTSNWAGFSNPFICVGCTSKSRTVFQVDFYIPVSSDGFNVAFKTLTDYLSSVYGKPNSTSNDMYWYAILDANNNVIGSIGVCSNYDYSLEVLKGFYMDDKGFNLNKREIESDL